MSLLNKVPEEKGTFWNKLSSQDNFYNKLGIILIIILLIIGALIFFVFKPESLTKLTSRISTPTPTPTIFIPSPTPIPLPKGPREFSASSKGVNPQIQGFKFSEYDPKLGEKQTITVSVLDGQGDVTSVELKMITDKKSKTYSMKLSSGTIKKGDWEVTLTTEDTHNYIYRLVITAKNNKGQKGVLSPIIK